MKIGQSIISLTFHNYPEHKKIMDKVISLGAKRHKKFELEVRAKEHHKLNLR